MVLVLRLCKRTSALPSRFFVRHNGKDTKNDINKKFGLPDPPTNCCMSGCANCVWIEYAEKLSERFQDGGAEAIREINESIEDPSLKAFLLHELRMRGLKQP